MRQKGFTLIELMIVIALISLIAMMAVPAASGFIDKRKIINAAEAIYSQLLFARSQGISRSTEVYANFGFIDPADQSTWRMSVSTHKGCDLSELVPDADYTDDCSMVVDNGDGVDDVNDLAYFITSGADFNGVEIDASEDGSGGAPEEISFNPTRGTAENVTVYLWFNGGDRQYAMRVVTGVIGRVRICTPAGDQRVPGYSTC